MKLEYEKILISKDELNEIVRTMAEKINHDYEGKDLVIVGMLKGAMPFMMDLIKYITIPIQIDFMQISSYHGGVESTNVVFKKDIETNVIGKHVIIVDDIIDTGVTLNEVLELFKTRKVASLEIAVLLDKPMHRKIDLTPKYIGRVIPDGFVVGYGLDYEEYCRNLPFVAILSPSVYKK